MSHDWAFEGTGQKLSSLLDGFPFLAQTRSYVLLLLRILQSALENCNRNVSVLHSHKLLSTKNVYLVKYTACNTFCFEESSSCRVVCRT